MTSRDLAGQATSKRDAVQRLSAHVMLKYSRGCHHVQQDKLCWCKMGLGMDHHSVHRSCRAADDAGAGLKWSYSSSAAIAIFVTSSRGRRARFLSSC